MSEGNVSLLYLTGFNVSLNVCITCEFAIPGFGVNYPEKRFGHLVCKGKMQ
jgi:hypothetical protein